jgi:tetratricopeptide (TPR) repeat protein
MPSTLGRAPRRSAAILALCLLVSGARLAAAKALPACKAALDRYDAEIGNASNDAALAAARALEKQCARPDADRALAVSRRAMVFYARNDIPATIGAFEEAVRLGPENPTLKMSLCGAFTQAKRYDDAIATCLAGLELAKAQDDGTEERHDRVLQLGFNLALAKVKRHANQCHDKTVFEAFDAYRVAHPDNAWVYQMLGAWVWDCDDDFDKGFALYKKSCALGQQSACEQIEYTESCQCQTRQDDGD